MAGGPDRAGLAGIAGGGAAPGPQERAWPVLLAVVLLRTMVHTGLFIVAHDAMHGLLLLNQPRWNHRLGALALALYGALGYGRCLRNHQLHHRQQATSIDPDFPGSRGAVPSAGTCISWAATCALSRWGCS